jgi:hypothetical protein
MCRDNKDVVTINLGTVRGFDQDSPMWPHFLSIVESFYNPMAYSYANMIFNNNVIDDMASDFEAKLKVAEERANAIECEVNKIKQTIAIVSGTLAKELEGNNGRDE